MKITYKIDEDTEATIDTRFADILGYRTLAEAVVAQICTVPKTMQDKVLSGGRKMTLERYKKIALQVVLADIEDKMQEMRWSYPKRPAELYKPRSLPGSYHSHCNVRYGNGEGFFMRFGSDSSPLLPSAQFFKRK